MEVQTFFSSSSTDGLAFGFLFFVFVTKLLGFFLFGAALLGAIVLLLPRDLAIKELRLASRQ